MKAIFSPGPSYSDPTTANLVHMKRWGNPELRKYAGWVRIFDFYQEALEELGCEVFTPRVPPEFIDQSSTVSKITSYDLYCAAQLPLDADLFLGPPGYSLAQMMKIRGRERWLFPHRDPAPPPKLFLYVWNNADWYRDEMLASEYQSFNQPYDLSPTWRWINRTALEMADHVIACSPFVKKTHAQVVPKDKISITFWGVDSEIFSPAFPEPPGFRVLFVGGDPIRKGLIYLLEALKGEGDAALRPYEFWIVGCAPLQGMPPHWKQFGMIPNSQIPDFYRQCHVLVCPTLEDGIALCVQEAMASGVVPITSEETADVFKDGVSGIKIPYRDPRAIKAALNMLKNNPEKCREMARAAGALAEQQTWQKMKEDVKEIIRRVMEGGELPYESPMPWLKGG